MLVEAYLDESALDESYLEPSRNRVVDDVITMGATALAAVSLLSDTFPDSTVPAFALIRTLGRVAEIESIIDPVIGTISLEGNRAERSHG